MYQTRIGTKLISQSRPRKRGLPPVLRGVVKPLTTEVYVDALAKSLADATPENISGVYDFKWQYLHTNILSKLPRAEYSSEYRSNAAIAKMFESELTCQNLNKNGFDNGFSLQAERFNTVMQIAKDIIVNTIGVDIDYQIFSGTRFSAGASTSRRKRLGDPYYKYKTQLGNPVHCTREAFKYGLAILDTTPLMRDNGYNIEIVPGNLVTTVPKKTEIDRTIAMEPDMNMSLQLAVGGHLRRCLRKQGINLNSQENNQRAAALGSVTNSLATIDLSSASDSISRHLVEFLLPSSWFTLMDDIRSQRGTLPNGKTFVWEKFSSMGNGFTFELETLIFWALAKALVRYELNAAKNLGKIDHFDTVIVYGDDIICHRMLAPSLIDVLARVGFKTNNDKTFLTGPFRESCGKHYYNGIDVTPFYIRSAIDHPQRVVWLLNRLRMWSFDETLGICDSSVWPLWRKLLKTYCPTALRGGKDINSTSAVAMPGPQRYKLVACTPKMKIDGVPAILRWFQSTRDVDPDPSALYVRVSRTKESLMIASVALPVTKQDRIDTGKSYYRYKRNREPWREYPLFSEEIVG